MIGASEVAVCCTTNVTGSAASLFSVTSYRSISRRSVTTNTLSLATIGRNQHLSTEPDLRLRRLQMQSLFIGSQDMQERIIGSRVFRDEQESQRHDGRHVDRATTMADVERLATLLRFRRHDVQIVLFGHLIELRSPDPHAGGDFQWLRDQHVSIGIAAGGVHQMDLAGPCTDVDPLIDHHRRGKGLTDSQISRSTCRCGPPDA